MDYIYIVTDQENFFLKTIIQDGCEYLPVKTKIKCAARKTEFKIIILITV